jgi:hypothetical protein
MVDIVRIVLDFSKEVPLGSRIFRWNSRTSEEFYIESIAIFIEKEITDYYIKNRYQNPINTFSGSINVHGLPQSHIIYDKSHQKSLDIYYSRWDHKMG